MACAADHGSELLASMGSASRAHGSALRRELAAQWLHLARRGTELGLGIMALMLVLFTVAALIAHAMKPRAAWPMLVVFYVVLGFLWYGNYSIIRFNLNSLASRIPSCRKHHRALR